MGGASWTDGVVVAVMTYVGYIWPFSDLVVSFVNKSLLVLGRSPMHLRSKQDLFIRFGPPNAALSRQNRQSPQFGLLQGSHTLHLLVAGGLAATQCGFLAVDGFVGENVSFLQTACSSFVVASDGSFLVADGRFLVTDDRVVAPDVRFVADDCFVLGTRGSFP